MRELLVDTRRYITRSPAALLIIYFTGGFGYRYGYDFLSILPK